MSLNTMSNFMKQKSSLCPSNGRQTVGDGALNFDNQPSVLAVCHLQGNDGMYYYSTAFSGGPKVGAFDTPKAKCPPDRGSSNCVTGSPASILSIYNDSLSSSPPSLSFAKPLIYPRSQAPITSIDYSHFSSPVAIPRSIPARHHSDLLTPPLTPDGGSDYNKSNGSSIHQKQENDALDFLMTVFPQQGLSALQYAKSVSISAPNMGASFEGIVLDLPGKPKTLYVDGKSAESVSLRESIVALLDLADESLQCSALVIVLERSSSNLGDLLHSLMYVGGAVVTKPPFKVDPAFVLVGLEV